MTFCCASQPLGHVPSTTHRRQDTDSQGHTGRMGYPAASRRPTIDRRPMEWVRAVRKTLAGGQKALGSKARVKGKEKRKEVYLCSDILSSISKRSDMDHTVLPANYTMSVFPS